MAELITFSFAALGFSILLWFVCFSLYCVKDNPIYGILTDMAATLLAIVANATGVVLLVCGIKWIIDYIS